MLQTLAVANYRSLREIVVPLGGLTVVTGPNGSGKSSLYRALRLLADVADGSAVAALAREGGLPSALWAGPERISRAMRAGGRPVEGGPRTQTIRLKLGFGADDFSYAVELGLPPQKGSAFLLDPQIKRECIWSGPALRSTTLLVDRDGPTLRARDAKGAWQRVDSILAPHDGMMTTLSDPRSAPEVLLQRERMRGWRFYDHFRVDERAPARRAQIGTFTPALDHEGRDVAAAIQTIFEIGDADAFATTIEDAFPGSTVAVSASQGLFALTMHQAGLLRPLQATELSDGTLRYVMLVAALLTPRPPELMVFNEPESSLHPDLVPALARLIARRSAATQILVVTHHPLLVAGLRDAPGLQVHELVKVLGETEVEGRGLLDRPAWHWPA